MVCCKLVMLFSVMNLITQVLLTAAVLAVAKWLFINIMIWQIYSGF